MTVGSAYLGRRIKPCYSERGPPLQHHSHLGACWKFNLTESESEFEQDPQAVCTKSLYPSPVVAPGCVTLTKLLNLSEPQ